MFTHRLIQKLRNWLQENLWCHVQSIQENKKINAYINTHFQRNAWGQTHQTYHLHCRQISLWVLFMCSVTEKGISEFKFPGRKQTFQSSSGCLESVYASFRTSWTLNLRFRSWSTDQNREAICHGLGGLHWLKEGGDEFVWVHVWAFVYIVLSWWGNVLSVNNTCTFAYILHRYKMYLHVSIRSHYGPEASYQALHRFKPSYNVNV